MSRSIHDPPAQPIDDPRALRELQDKHIHCQQHVCDALRYANLRLAELGHNHFPEKDCEDCHVELPRGLW